VDEELLYLSSHCLKKLVILDSMFEGGLKTISAPSLVWLELTDNTDAPLLGSMPSLVKAFVRLQDFCNKDFEGSCSDSRCDNCGDNGRRNENCMLLNGLSNAESLELVAPPGEIRLCLLMSTLLLFLLKYFL
jgi:hypothetical protein